MPYRHASLALLPIIVIAACGEDQSPTAPSSPSGHSAEVAAAAAGQRVVNSLADPGDGTCNARQCTLREAIEASGTTAITFASGLAGTITLADAADDGGALNITTSVTITAPAAGITVRRRSTDSPFRIVRIGQGAEVTLTRLTLRNGRTAPPGAGVLNLGRLTLVDCTVTGNTSGSTGGGIANVAVLTLTRTTVSNNTGHGVGGIDNGDGRLIATNSVVTRNHGDGLGSPGGTLKLTGSRFSDNTGTGVWEDRGGPSTLDHVSITGNGAGGYSLSHGNTTIAYSTIAGNSGGAGAGIFNSFDGHLTLSKSTVSGNSASGQGGGIYNEDDNFARVGGSIRIVNSTVTGNSAQEGGGIFVDDNGSASVSVENSTVAFNTARLSGGGIANESFGEFPPVGIHNSIVAGNTAPTAPDVRADATATFSLIGDGTGSGLTNTGGNKVGRVAPNAGPIDPRLGALADNGGATRTLALLAGSPAIDAASASGCPGKDQRDVVRPRGTACDMGSFER
jgi:CSLREA domain-containing protein